MSHDSRKPTMWFPNRSDTNPDVQSQKQARSLKFRIQEEEDDIVYYVAKTKVLICIFVFAYADEPAYLCHQPEIIILYLLFQGLFRVFQDKGYSIILTLGYGILTHIRF